jgi:hypothetical protein
MFPIFPNQPGNCSPFAHTSTISNKKSLLWYHQQGAGDASGKRKLMSQSANTIKPLPVPESTIVVSSLRFAK